MLRYKVLIGRGLRARTLPTQKTEVACRVINFMNGLGMSVSRRSLDLRGNGRNPSPTPFMH
jgi:hypothetical protein